MTEETPKRLGLFRRYLDPDVANRLINYYASDEGFSVVTQAVGIAATLPELVDRLPDLNIDRLVDLTRDTMFGTISSMAAGEFFSKLSDFVANRDTIMWYADINTTNTIFNLLEKKTEILELARNFSVLEWYVLQREKVNEVLGGWGHGEGWIKNQLESFVIGNGLQRIFRDLVLEDREGNMRKIIVGDLKLRDIEFGLIADKLNWVADDGIISRIDAFMSRADELRESMRANLEERLHITWDYDFWAVQAGFEWHFFSKWVDENDVVHDGGYDGTGMEAVDTWIRTIQWRVSHVIEANDVSDLRDAMITFSMGFRSLFRNLLDINWRILEWTDKFRMGRQAV